MKTILLFLLEIARIVLVFFIVYVLVGLFFRRFYVEDNFSEYMKVWYIHFFVAFVMTFVWYRLKGIYTGWFRKVGGEK
ncbi:hypothetical protein EDD64_13237 [Effusibacillus lacus]|nr:hypothetical protein EDD64_13237 [Effusibacillus lacus]